MSQDVFWYVRLNEIFGDLIVHYDFQELRALSGAHAVVLPIHPDVATTLLALTARRQPSTSNGATCSAQTTASILELHTHTLKEGDRAGDWDLEFVQVMRIQYLEGMRHDEPTFASLIVPHLWQVA